MNKGIEIIIGSPVDYDELVAYIVIDGDHIALLNQDEGKDKIIIEFFDDIKNKKIDLNDFEKALKDAKNLLLK